MVPIELVVGGGSERRFGRFGDEKIFLPPPPPLKSSTGLSNPELCVFMGVQSLYFEILCACTYT